jgi:hypothetical protein
MDETSMSGDKLYEWQRIQELERMLDIRQDYDEEATNLEHEMGLIDA